MKKIVSLTETQLNNIIKKVIKEASCPPITLTKPTSKGSPSRYVTCPKTWVPCDQGCCGPNNQCVNGVWCQHNDTCEVTYPRNR